MNHLDFFKQYHNNKQISESLFNKLESKFINLNENKINEGAQNKIVAFPEDVEYKYIVVDEDDDNYLTVQEEKYEHWKNANKIDRATYYSEWIPKSEMIEVGNINEGIFGKNESGRKEDIKKNFNQILTVGSWDTIKLDLGNKQFVEIGKATKEEQDKAWAELEKQASADKFSGNIKNNKGFVVYDAKNKNAKQQTGGGNQQQATGGNQTQQAIVGSGATQTQQPSNYELIQTKNGIQFGGPERVVGRITSPASSAYENHNWKDSPLKFLFESPLKFKGDEIAFDLDNEVIANFLAKDGYWNGNFVGKTFDSKWIGGTNYTFKGDFLSNNKNFEGHPTLFVGGTFSDLTDTGILGLNNIEEATESDNFNLIQVPVGFSIEILTNKQLRHTITVSKRLDESDSNFGYVVYMGYDIDSRTPNNVTLSWEQIRAKYNSYQINSKIKSIPEVLDLQSGEEIIEIRVLKAGTPPVFKNKERFDASKQYSENPISLIDGFRTLKSAIPSIVRGGFNFKINNDQDFENLNKIKGYFNSKKFAQDLDAVSTFLDSNTISQADIDKYGYLKNVFPDGILNEVNLGGSGYRQSKLMTPKGTSSALYDTFNNKEIKTDYDIIEFLNSKYTMTDPASKLKNKVNFEREYADLRKKLKNKGAVGGVASSTANVSSASQPLGDSDFVLKRLDDFVKHFVYKIDASKKTPEVRSYFLNAIKDRVQKNIQKPVVAQPVAQPVVQTTSSKKAKSAVQPIAKTAASKKGKSAAKTNNPNKGKSFNLKAESYIRLEVRKILKDLL